MRLLLVKFRVESLDIYDFQVLSSRTSTELIRKTYHQKSEEPFFLIFYLLIYIGLSLKPLKIYASFFIYELPLAIEEQITSSTTVTRSRQLVEGLQTSIVKTFFIMYLTTIPILFSSDLLQRLILGFTLRSIYHHYHYFTYLVIQKITWIIYWGSLNILINPFWQTLKSMVYYHLRCQKEAFDLPLDLASSWSSDDAGDFVEMGSESSDESPEVG